MIWIFNVVETDFNYIFLKEKFLNGSLALYGLAELIHYRTRMNICLIVLKVHNV
jgi:hypothetical protein